MPLSEHEQRQLEQIEQALYADYPKLAQAVRAKDPRIHYKRRVVYAAIGFLIGVGLLMAGVVYKTTYIGVGGFVVMLACAMWALTSWRHMGGSAAGRSASASPGRSPVRGPAPGPGRERGQRRGQTPRKNRRGRAAKGSFMERLEERWRRRQQGGGR
ncbi:MAG TPA: DUF3040 domain-containing protein [Streptosporangiaceae bacterium]|nr:DUF3040 domain-containing protein [Streptosporangiaceae bacterium]